VLGPGIAQRFADAARITPAEEAGAREVLATARAQLRARIGAGVAVLAPATSTAAPALDASTPEKATLRAATLRLTCLAGAAGLPSAVAPAALVDGRPVGLAVLGAAGSDTALTGLLATWGRALVPPG
jgi:Asp-tRNA(Asn)/Glu-tRNA(Gln) amidotransferase A subunit family amidase